MHALAAIGERLPIIFPVHPRTRQRLSGMPGAQASSIRCIDPVGYLDFLGLQQHAAVVITDSGGIQEETTFLGVPCLTLRENTERPITIEQGTNLLIGQDMQRLRQEVTRIVSDRPRPRSQPPLWDGQASTRVVAVVERWLGERDSR
jgi:UDP-N-acetylglucosamine 2-epimerase (non-hydrolysing)